MDYMFTIYLDMDGVICDFNKEYKKTFGISPSEADRNKKEFSKNWTIFCEGRHFEKLDYWPGANQLLGVVSAISTDPDVTVEMLTSTGGLKYHDLVAEQKEKWLSDHYIHYKANCVSGRVNKKKFAGKWKILIDDTEDCIDGFNENGGIGILHKDVNETVTKLQNYYLQYLASKVNK